MEAHELNRLASRVWTSLIDRYPSFSVEAECRKGELEAAIPAPIGSQAGYMVVFTDKDSIWVRFAPPYMCYPLDDTDEMLSILEQLLLDSAVFAVVMSGDEWRETTLIRAGQHPTIKPDERVQIVSWSGKYDETINPT